MAEERCPQWGAAALTCSLQTEVTTGWEHLGEAPGLQVIHHLRMASPAPQSRSPPDQTAGGVNRETVHQPAFLPITAEVWSTDSDVNRLLGRSWLHHCLGVFE